MQTGSRVAQLSHLKKIKCSEPRRNLFSPGDVSAGKTFPSVILVCFSQCLTNLLHKNATLGCVSLQNVS